jgi:hypothetical protein
VPDPPIPPGFWRRILAYLRAGKTGTVVLRVAEGRVVGVDVTEVLASGEDRRVDS